MLDLIDKNREMLNNGSYNLADQRQMLKIDSLAVKNDYDLYLIACCLCNYPIDEKQEAIDLRMEYFLKTNRGCIDGYEHMPSDYSNSLFTNIICKNTNKVNKFGLYEYEINCIDRDLISDLWSYKAKDCLKYVDSKSFKDKIIVSIGKTQLNNFIAMLNELLIQYNSYDIENNINYKNKSNFELDLSRINPPFAPYNFQIEDAKTIIKKKRALIGHEMGSGKTFISIAVGASINVPKLVICPESLRINWYNEIKAIHTGADVQINKINEEPHFGKDWTIVGYLTASKWLDKLKSFECIFVDECHNCKAVNNWGKPSSKRASSVIDLAMSAEYCYLLSGTPMPSKNIDIYNILKMLKCEVFDFNSKWAFKNFADRFCDPKKGYYGMDYTGNSNSNELHNIINGLMIRRLKKDVLPHLKKQRQFIPITPLFKRDYNDIERRLYYPETDDGYLGLAMSGRRILSKYKLSVATDLADTLVNAGESVVIVTNFVDSADALKNYYKNKCCEIRGGMSDEEKDSSIKSFQAKEVPVCILNMQAGGVGITLTAASTMIIVDYAWLPADMVQVEDRICRAGQTKPCMIYYVYCTNSTLDATFVEMISTKSENIDEVIDNTDNTFDLKSTKESNYTFIEALKKKIKEATI